MVESVKQARPIVPSCPVVEWIVRKARRWEKEKERGAERWKRYRWLSVRRKRAKKEDNSRENCWSKGVFAYLEGRRFLSSKKGEVIIKSPRFSFLFSHQDKYKVEQIFINTHLFSSFLFIFFFSSFIITHDITLCCSRSIISNLPIFISGKLIVYIPPVQNFSMEKLEISIPNKRETRKQHDEYRRYQHRHRFYPET